jgi:cytidine deaminase
MKVYIYSKNGLDKVVTIKELTPYPFEEEDMQ